jgi:hypothetical protein
MLLKEVSMSKAHQNLITAIRKSIKQGGDDYDIIERVSRREGVSLTRAKNLLIELRSSLKVA